MKIRNRFFPVWLCVAGMGFLLLNNCGDKLKVATLTTTPVTNITSNAATSGGTIEKDGGSVIFEKGICWSLNTLPTIDDMRTIDSTAGETFVSNMANLTPNTVYYVRAYASNEAGTGYGDELVFTTLEGSSATGDLEVYVREASGSGPYIGDAEVKIYLSQEDRDNNNAFKTGTTSKDNPSVNGALFTGLTYRKYFIRASYTNDKGLWMGVHEIYITTGQTTKTQVVTVL